MVVMLMVWVLILVVGLEVIWQQEEEELVWRGEVVV
jgi:hypothetical protein